MPLILYPPNGNITLDFFLLLFEGDRAHLRFQLQRVAQLDGASALGKPADDLVMELSLYEEPRARDTGLTTGREDARNHPVDDSFVRVGEDNVGRLS